MIALLIVLFVLALACAAVADRHARVTRCQWDNFIRDRAYWAFFYWCAREDL